MPDCIPLSSLEPKNKKTFSDYVPPPRFGTTTFESYIPQHPSQEKALEKTEAFLGESTSSKPRWFWQSPKENGKGLYLDGGFGVGKTHLLASAFEAFSGSKLYLSFSELVHAIGVLGMPKAKEELGTADLYCIDEFELDDPGNTLIVKTFLAHVFMNGAKIITTSNTLPSAQGQGRFNADDFKREIQSIAEHFESVSIDGPDYRKRDQIAAPLSRQELEKLKATDSYASKVCSTHQPFFEELRAHHPINYHGLLKQVDAFYLTDLKSIETQNDALRFVHFIDKLYDMMIPLRLTGMLELENLFDESYRNSAYAKKHYRCLSRLSELLEEAREDL